MNILYLAHRIPYPPNKGDKLRALRQIEWLARRHRVWCACFVDDPADRKYATELARRCHAVAAIPLNRALAKARGLAGLAVGTTITESFYRHGGMTDRIAKWHRAVGFDTVVAFSSSMASYALSIPGVRRVLDMCDLDSRKWADYAGASRGPAR
ncbi:MAG: hypothetical protein IIB61_06765, partial [Planctomycetes bacterium]|nr:hypothetical protein [Planctomycetota bacterium]